MVNRSFDDRMIRRLQQSGGQSVRQPDQYTNGEHADATVLHIANFSLAQFDEFVTSLEFVADTIHVLPVAPSHLPIPAPESSADDAAHYAQQPDVTASPRTAESRLHRYRAISSERACRLSQHSRIERQFIDGQQGE